VFVLTDMTLVYRMQKWRPIERAMAPSNHLFVHGGITTSDWFSDKL